MLWLEFIVHINYEYSHDFLMITYIVNMIILKKYDSIKKLCFVLGCCHGIVKKKGCIVLGSYGPARFKFSVSYLRLSGKFGLYDTFYIPDIEDIGDVSSEQI